jgi:hypothetical protein
MFNIFLQLRNNFNCSALNSNKCFFSFRFFTYRQWGSVLLIYNGCLKQTQMEQSIQFGVRIIKTISTNFIALFVKKTVHTRSKASIEQHANGDT